MSLEKKNGSGNEFFAAGEYAFETETDRPVRSWPLPLSIAAQLVSYIFHPLFIPGYVTAFLLYVHPYAFAGFDERLKLLRLISVVLLTFFFPAFTVFLLKKLGFVDSMYLKTRKERIIPYITSMFFFFWIFYVSRNLPDSPRLYVAFLLSLFIASIAALMANIYFKVSMHAIAMGGLFAFFVMLGMEGTFSMGSYLALATIIAGLVCTARLMVSNHFAFEIYSGFFIGVICQVLALAFV